MTDREKLIELLRVRYRESAPCDTIEYRLPKELAEKIADHLLANGVTFATDNHVGGKWIPVTERMPELHTKVLCCGVKGGRFIAELSEWGNGILYWTKRDGKGCPTVTHWMPLPELPMRKGENG